MDKKEFRNILFKTAVLAMSCDGEIHEAEVKELQEIAGNTTYFTGIEYNYLLKEQVNIIKEKGKKAIKEYFDLIRDNKFTASEELLILEVVLRIIQADKKIDENEEKFLNILRRLLSVSDELIKLRFGNINYLMLSKFSSLEMAIKRDIDINFNGLKNINDSSLNFEKIEDNKKKTKQEDK